jgi:hypothetical protein
MNDKMEAGRRVASRLFPAENTIDEALLANAALQIALVGARRDIQAPCGTNQGMLADLVASNNALIEARQKLVGLHAKVVRAQRELGMEALPFGCERPCLNTDQPPIEGRLKVAS